MRINMNTELLIKDGWTCTDPDNNQWGKKIKDGHYQFMEERNGEWFDLDIVLKHYEPEEVENYVSAYYKSVEEVKEIYGDDAEWIIAECVFEQESLLY